MGTLKGKTAIITGGGRAVLSDGSCGSIGYGIATAYAKEGANNTFTWNKVSDKLALFVGNNICTARNCAVNCLRI